MLVVVGQSEETQEIQDFFFYYILLSDYLDLTFYLV